MKVGKATDGLLGARNLHKPRYYAVIDEEEDNSIIVAKIYGFDSNNPSDVRRLNLKLRKLLTRFKLGRNKEKVSSLDRSLYIEKANKQKIFSHELDYENAENFRFREKESRNLRRFVFSSKTNRNRYFKYKKTVF